MNSELLNRLLLLRFSNSHILRSVSFLPFVYSTTNTTIWRCKGCADTARPTDSKLFATKPVVVISNKLKMFFVDVLSSSACPNVLDCGRETLALHARHRLLVILRRRAARGGGVLSLDR